MKIRIILDINLFNTLMASGEAFIENNLNCTTCVLKLTIMKKFHRITVIALASDWRYQLQFEPCQFRKYTNIYFPRMLF
jgi:hypothetical protein